MSEYKKSFKKLIEELANLESFTDESIGRWFAAADMSFQHEGINWKEQQMCLALARKIMQKGAEE